MYFGVFHFESLLFSFFAKYKRELFSHNLLSNKDKLCLFPGQQIDGAAKEPVDEVNLKLLCSSNK